MAKPLNFQQIILKLHNFWSDEGCLIWNPYNVQVGAGFGKNLPGSSANIHEAQRSRAGGQVFRHRFNQQAFDAGRSHR